MSDKKKKIFNAKEFNTTRRPVLLKYDRESSRDPPKDKPEKEKQPTIILKTREQSAAKEERSQSPSKAQTSDDAQHQAKSHNDNKEKKTIEQKPSAPLKLMSEAIKLFDENLDFNTSALEFLNDSSCNYLVVGILGTQGVGKSMVLNLLAQNSHCENLCDILLNSHEVVNQYEQNVASVEKQLDSLQFTEQNESEEGNKPGNILKFKMQDMQHIETGVNCTKGIDMYITSDRIILLDCEAFCANPLPAQNASVATVMYLQIASFLMTVCHVLIAVQDWFTDYNFLRYIQAAEMLRPSMSSSSSVAQDAGEAAGTGESEPHLLLLHNRCQLEDFTPDAVATMQNLYRKAFQKSDLQLKSGMYMYSDTNKNGLNIDSVREGYSVDKCGSPINLFLLPDIYEDHDDKDLYRGHPSFEQLAKRLRWLVLGVNRHQISNVPNLSEKGWFHYCNKAWETIRKCKFFKEYERFLP